MGVGSAAYRRVHTKGGVHKPIWVLTALGDKAHVYRCAVCSQSLIEDNDSRKRGARKRRRKWGWPG